MSNVIVTHNGYYSTDNGLSFTASTGLPNPYPIEKIGWNGTIFCAIPRTGRIVCTSADGITWTQHVDALPVTQFIQDHLYDDPKYTRREITWNGTIFCTVCFNDNTGVTVTCTSPDGISWTQGTNITTGQSWKLIQWTGTRFLMVDTGSYSRLATSTDGLVWTDVTGIPTWPEWTYYSPCAMAQLLNGTVCVVLRSSSKVLLSTDEGATWTAVDLSSISSYSTIATDGNNLVIMPQGWLSTDSGATWSIHATGSYMPGVDITYNGEVFLVSPYQDSGDSGAYSTNGNTWTLFNFGGAAYSSDNERLSSAFIPVALPVPIMDFWKDYINSEESDV